MLAALRPSEQMEQCVVRIMSTRTGIGLSTTGMFYLGTEEGTQILQHGIVELQRREVLAPGVNRIKHGSLYMRYVVVCQANKLGYQMY